MIQFLIIVKTTIELLLFFTVIKRHTCDKYSITKGAHASTEGKDEQSRNIHFHQHASRSSFSFFLESRSSIKPDEKTQMEEVVRIRISCPCSFIVTKLSLSIWSAVLYISVCFVRFDPHDSD
ncbi:hypothetical protein NPIL_584351 [Nephila pilipes]|uniref:Uncharacterized protein n=1 Tax=Nephila pilipes TaxID=299642 RepID=A0A8X6P8V9_NEPPI|nr:hypothetical protein NPIL_584351 [Nephila pilipes]